MNTTSTPTAPHLILQHLHPDIWKKVNLLHIKKAISEFAHELLILPELLHQDGKWGFYSITADDTDITYHFYAKKCALDHWHIDEKTLEKCAHNKHEELDSLRFILEFRNTLGIPDEMLPTYMEEITSTLSSAAYKYGTEHFTAKDLIHGDFQDIEHAMTEGHPCFVANNGRIGFSTAEFQKYAPEANTPFSIVWIAGHKNNTDFYCTQDLSYTKVLFNELGEELITRFNLILLDHKLSPDDYVFMPVHPWQWDTKISTIFAQDIANKNIVFLGESEDHYAAQQSIRTLYNLSAPEKFYTKTALSILNMGFMRGLSPYYMSSTPPITEWISGLLDNDPYLQKTGFTMLREVATVGYRNLYFETLGTTKAHNKMLSALWRESPMTKITKDQRLMTMAAFLHVDNEGNSLLAEIIKASPIDTATWIKKYMYCYLSPLLHSFYAYGIVFMPHGENLIMVMEDHIPVKAIMKDITEEVLVFNKDIALPEKVQRLYTEASDEMQVLSIFTDVFDCFFRFMAHIIDTHCDASEDLFWKLVASCIHTYQEDHPALEAQFIKYDLFVTDFKRCCLNRLQLNNTKQMLNLADPIQSLQLVGTLQNPIAKYRKITESV